MVCGVETSRWSAGRTSSAEGWRLRLSGPADTLSNSRHPSLCRGTGGHVAPVWLVCVCAWTYVSEWVGGRQWCITHQQALSRLPLFGAQIRPSTHTYTPTQTRVHSTSIPFTIGHIALLTHCRIPSKFVDKDNTLLLSMKRLGAV